MARIVYAEDDELVAEVVRDALTAAGHVVGVATDGEAALRAIELKQPDLAILDCGLPRIGGVDVLRQIRVSHRAYATPVLMLTARQSSSDVDLAMHAGANAYLKKPFDPDRLVFMVEDLLDQAERRRNFA